MYKKINDMGMENPGYSVIHSGRAEGPIKRVLIVEDEDSLRYILSEIVSSMGFDVAVARNGKEGLHLFRENPFDMVLTDLRMPFMDGISMSRHIRERSCHTPIILLTGENKEHVFRLVQRTQVDSILFKPFRLEDIEKTVQEVIDVYDNHGIASAQ